MTTSVLIQFNCDARGCTQVVRSSHWTALGAQAEVRAKMRRAGWRVVESPNENNKGDRRHFCRDHSDDARWTPSSYDGPAIDLCRQWNA